jgi:putative DNA primase/helicase
MSGQREKQLAADIERDFGGDVVALLTRQQPGPLDDLGTLDLTDAGMAALVAGVHGRSIRRVHDTGEWRAFDGQRWKGGEAAVKRIERAILDVGRELYDRAPGLEAGLAKAAARASMRVLSDAGTKAVLSRLTAVQSIGCMSDIFDSDGEALNVGNGTLNLRTGELRPHRAEDFITRLIELSYAFEARAERWERALAEIFAANPEIPEYLQRAIGYAATGLMREHVFHLLLGTGRNGKSLVVEALANVLGEYGLAIASDALARAHDLQRPRPDIALMRGRRFVFSQEANRGTPLDEALIKKLSGGDTISERVLHQNPITFRSTAKLFLSTNHAPEISGTETAIWRRVRLIPFKVSFSGREDVNLSRKLEAEREGILAWVVDGARRYFAEGLDAPGVVTAATDEYRRQSDQLGRFADECLELIDGAAVAASRLQAAYKTWCAANGEREQRAALIAEYLSAKGVEKRRASRGLTYFGVSVKPEMEASDDV